MLWDYYFIKMAELVASKSKDRSTKGGAVIVGPDNEVRSTGYNGFPRGVNDNVEERHERPIKYSFVEHAERNAIYNAARVGIPIKGCAMYFNFEPYPCTECAKAIIQSGIIRLIGSNIPFPGVGEQWKKDWEISQIMLNEAGVEIIKLEENQ